jgi:secretion/DNA translocation related TadE-like protein
LRRREFRRPNLADDRGSATVVAAAMVLVLLTVTGGGAALGSVVVARHRAQAAADLAALAAASRLPAGPVTACAWATRLAHLMRGDEADCVVEGLDVVVTVRIAVPVAGRFSVRAAARAGPV